MWTVANQLRGVLRFPGLGVEIPPGGEFDLDSVGREKADASTQVKLALESGYLKTVRKTIMLDESEISRLVEERIRSIKESLVTEINDLYKEQPTARAS